VSEQILVYPDSTREPLDNVMSGRTLSLERNESQSGRVIWFQTIIIIIINEND